MSVNLASTVNINTYKVEYQTVLSAKLELKSEGQCSLIRAKFSHLLVTVTGLQVSDSRFIFTSHGEDGSRP